MQALIRQLDRCLGVQYKWNSNNVCFSNAVEFEITEEDERVSAMSLRFLKESVWRATNLHMIDTHALYNMSRSGLDQQLFIQANPDQPTKLKLSYVPTNVEFEKINPKEIEFTFTSFRYSGRMSMNEDDQWLEAISGADTRRLSQATVAIRQHVSGTSEVHLKFGAGDVFVWHTTLNVNDTELLYEIFRNSTCTYMDITLHTGSTLTVNFPGAVYRPGLEAEGIRIKVDFVRGA